MVQTTINGLFEESKEAWLAEARATAIKLLSEKPSITIDDVTELCPRPNYLHKNTTGSVFKTGDFKAVGYTKSTKPSRNGGLIVVWGLK